jgi:hypothetical protein
MTGGTASKNVRRWDECVLKWDMRRVPEKVEMPGGKIYIVSLLSIDM